MAQKICVQDLNRVKELMRQILGDDRYTDMERMGGLTNHTYKVSLPDGASYVIRIPGEGTEELINRADEQTSTRLACKLGVDTELLFFGDKGEKVTRYIEDAVTMSPETMRKKENLVKAAEIFRTLHTSGADTKVPFEVFDMAASYESIIRKNGVFMYEDYPAVKSSVMAIKCRVDADGEARKVPCHNDPLCENWVLDGNGRMYLIDWEYAGMNDGMWDLADLSIEAMLTARQDEILLESYFGRKPVREENQRFFANKLYLDFLWTLWGKTRVPFDGETMEQYAAQRYDRLKKNLESFSKI